MAEAQQISDGDLLVQVNASGSQECFTELVRRHGPMVLGVCQRQLGNGHDAEDAAQAVFLVLWEKAASLRRRSSVAGWLHHVACNVCRNASKAKHIRMKHEREAAKMIDARSQHQKEWDEIKDLLDDELDGLPEKYRLPLVLFHLEDRSLEEIAVLLHLNKSPLTTRCPFRKFSASPWSASISISPCWIRGDTGGEFMKRSSRLSRGREQLRRRLVRRGVVMSVTTFTGLLANNSATARMPLFFAEKVARAAYLHSAGQPAVGGLVSAPILACQADLESS